MRVTRCAKAMVWLLLGLPVAGLAAFIPENQRRIETVTFHVSALGDDAARIFPWRVP